MPKNLSKLRAQAASRQSFRCIYCRCPVWHGDPGPFRARFGLSAKQAQFFQCTAEHLEARRDGGLNVGANIAAACWHCNQTRHRSTRPLAPAEFGQRAQRRASKGGWFPGGLAARVM